MLFSIIVPVFNTVSSLQACIESVVSQSFPDWELLLVDDGSSDGSEHMIDEFSQSDLRIRAFHQDNSGPFVARRTGIASAEGDYILFLDSDDRLESGSLSRIESAIRAIDPDILLFVGKKYLNGIDTGKRFGYMGSEDSCVDTGSVKKSIISSHEYNSLCNKAFRRVLFDRDETDYDNMRGRCMGEDKVQFLRPLTAASAVYYIADELYIYNSRPDSAVNDIDFGTADRMLANSMFSHLWSYMQQWGMTDAGSTEAFYVYYIRNFLSVYYGLRKKCVSSKEMRRFRSHRWDTVNKKAFRYSNSRLLTRIEKLKCLAARLHY